MNARHVHGDDGMGDLAWPAPDRAADPRHAVELLRDLLVSAVDDPITLVTLAPMTNTALLQMCIRDRLCLDAGPVACTYAVRSPRRRAGGGAFGHGLQCSKRER